MCPIPQLSHFNQRIPAPAPAAATAELTKRMKYERNTKTATGSTKVSEHETYNLVGKCNAVFSTSSLSSPHCFCMVLLLNGVEVRLVVSNEQRSGTICMHDFFSHSMHNERVASRSIWLNNDDDDDGEVAILFLCSEFPRNVLHFAHTFELMKKKCNNHKKIKVIAPFDVVSPQCNFYLNCVLLSY